MGRHALVTSCSRASPYTGTGQARLESTLRRRHARAMLDPRETITLEPSGVRLSRMGFGAAALGGEYGELEAVEGTRAVHCAIDEGIVWFDTAPYYGRTLSETRLGNALEGRRDRVTIATKCARLGREEFDFSAAGIRTQVEDSLRRLRTDHIDLYQIHDVEFTTRTQVLEETLPALAELRAEGKIRAVGITGLHPHLLLALCEGSSVTIDAVLTYCHHDMLDWTLRDEWATRFAAMAVPLLSASPTHMGILTRGGPQEWHPAPESVLEIGRRMARACREAGEDLARIALAEAFAQPGPQAILIGARTAEEVCSSLAAVEEPAAGELLTQLRDLARQVQAITWNDGLHENAPS